MIYVGTYEYLILFCGTGNVSPGEEIILKH